MWEFDAKRGGWLKDGVPAQEAPPIGAAFWRQDENGNWSMETVTPEVMDQIKASGAGPVRSGGYGDDNQSRPDKIVTTNSDGTGTVQSIDYKTPTGNPLAGVTSPGSSGRPPMTEQEMRDRIRDAEGRPFPGDPYLDIPSLPGMPPVPGKPSAPADFERVMDTLTGGPTLPGGGTPAGTTPSAGYSAGPGWVFSNGLWFKDGARSETPPPVGTPFTKVTGQGSTATRETVTMTEGLDPSAPIVQVPVPQIPPPGPANPPLVDGRISPERIANQEDPPPGVSAEAWAEIKAGTYAPPRNSLSPGGPTDQAGTLLYPAKPEATKPEPTFRMPSTFEGRFAGNDDGTLRGGTQDLNFDPGLLASIQQMIDGGGDGAARAQHIMSGLSAGRMPDAPLAGRKGGGPTNLIDRLGAEWDAQNASNRRASAPEAPKVKAPPEREYEYTQEEDGGVMREEIPMPVSTGKDSQSKRYTRRYAKGSGMGRYGPQPVMTRPAESFPMPGQRTMPTGGAGSPIGRMPQMPLPPGGIGTPIMRPPAPPMTMMPTNPTYPVPGNPTQRTMPGQGVPMPQAQPRSYGPYQRRFARGTGGAGYSPAPFR